MAEVCSPTSVVPQETAPDMDVQAQVSAELEECVEIARRDGSRLPQYAILFWTTGEAGEVTMGVQIKDPDDVLDGGPALLDSYQRVPDEGIQSVQATLLTSIDDAGRDTSPPSGIVSECGQCTFLRCEPAESTQFEDWGGNQITAGVADCRPLLAALARFTASCELPAVTRVHLAPVIQDGEMVLWPGHPDRAQATSDCAETVTAVGYRPTITALMFSSSAGHGSSYITNVGESLDAALGDAFSVLELQGYDVTGKTTEDELVSTTVEANETAQFEIARGYGRMLRGEGAPLRSQEAFLSPREIAYLFQPFGYDEVLDCGVRVSQSETALSGYTPRIRERLYSDRGTCLGVDAGTPRAALSVPRRPQVHGILSDSNDMRLRLTAEQIHEHQQEADVTVVIDPTGELTEAYARRAASDPDAVDVVRLCPGTHDLSVAPFDIERLLDVGWSDCRAIDYVSETYQALLAAADLPYTVDDSPFEGGITASRHDADALAHLKTVLEAGLASEAVEQVSHERFVALLRDYRTQQRRGDAECDFGAVGPDVARRAYKHAQAIGAALPDRVTKATRTQDPLIERFANRVVCIDLSEYANSEPNTLNILTVLLLRSLTTQIITERARSEHSGPSVTIAVDTAARVPSYAFMAPIVDQEAVRPDVTLVAGFDATQNRYTQPRQTTLFESLTALTVATEPDAPHRHYEAVTGNVVPDALATNDSIVREQADRPGVGAVLVDGATVSVDTPLGLRIELPGSLPSTDSVIRPPDSESTDSNRSDAESTRANAMSLDAAVTVSDEFEQLTPPVIHHENGAQCPVCDSYYDTLERARQCHDHGALQRLQADAAPAGLTPLYDCDNVGPATEVQAAFEEALGGAGLPAQRLSFSADASLSAVVAEIREQLPTDADTDLEIDAWAHTFLTAVELARCGALPGYQLTESMSHIRDATLTNSAQTVDDLLNPTEPAQTPLIQAHWFEGNKYYEVTPAAISTSAAPNLRETDSVLLGASLRDNQAVCYGARQVARRVDEGTVQVPHTLSAAGTNAFAAFDDNNRLVATGTVVTTNAWESAPRTLTGSISTQYERFRDTTGEAIWVCTNVEAARHLLTYLDYHGHVKLPDVTLDNYSRQHLQRRVVDDLDAPGIDTIWTIAHLHRRLR